MNRSSGNCGKEAGVAIGSVFFGLALTVLAGVLVADPFLRRGIFNRRGKSPSARERRRSALLAIRDLDFDFQTGKVLEEDYRAWRARLLEQAARWLTDEGRAESELAEAVEAEVAKIGKTALGARFCPSCGRAQVSGDRFCTNCGQALAHAGGEPG